MANKTFTDGSILTAAEVNTYLMEQANIVCTSITRPTSPPTGMEIYETDTGFKLRYTGSAWRDVEKQPAAVVYRSTAQTGGGWTAVAFNETALLDTDDFHDETTNNTRLTVPAGLGGWYLLTARVQWAASGTARRGIGYQINGGTNVIVLNMDANASTSHYSSASEVVELDAADYLELTMNEESGSIDGCANARASLTWIGRA